MRKKGLTLVELLVVIGLILFITATFIFPAYERARGKATEVVCVSNLRQIGQALLMYAQDHDGLVLPYCNLDSDIKLTSLKARRWRTALNPYVQDNGIFFCPVDPFAGLSPNETPSQGMPIRSGLDHYYARSLDHSITSYISCPSTLVNGEVLDIEDWFSNGYYLTTDIYQNMRFYPLNWLFAPPYKDMEKEMGEENFQKILWAFIIVRLHDVSVFVTDYTHFAPSAQRHELIELFYDGSVDFDLAPGRPCYVWKQLEAQYKPKEGD